MRGALTPKGTKPQNKAGKALISEGISLHGNLHQPLGFSDALSRK